MDKPWLDFIFQSNKQKHRVGVMYVIICETIERVEVSISVFVI